MDSIFKTVITILITSIAVTSFSVSASDKIFKEPIEDCVYPDSTDTKYSEVSCLLEGIAVVKVGLEEDARFGLIDAEGQEILPPEYYFFLPFSEGLFKALKNEKMGLINRRGEIVLPVIYDFVGSFGREYGFDGYTTIMLGKASTNKQRMGLINNQGKIVIEPKYLFIYSSGEDDLIEVSIKDEEVNYDDISYGDVKYGLSTYDDKIIVPLDYDEPIRFYESFARICKDKKCNFTDKKGQLLLPYWVDAAGNFVESRAWVNKEGNFGYIDESAQTVIPYIYNDAEDFEYGRAIVSYDNANLSITRQDEKSDNEYYGVIDIEGNTIVPFEYQRITRVTPNLLYADKADDFYFLDNDGDLATETKYEDIVYGSLFNSLLAVKKGGKWGFVDYNFQNITPFEYETALEFNDDLAAVEKNSQFGFIDDKGDLIIPFEYDDAIDITDWEARLYGKYRFTEGVAILSKNNHWGVIDKDNNIVVPFEYENILNHGYYIEATKSGVQYKFDLKGNVAE